MIERDWTTAAGLRAVVTMTERGYRCGYVAVPEEYPLYGVFYTDWSPTVHGGLTYSSHTCYPIKDEGLWWFGFDCDHYMDTPSPEWIAAQPAKVKKVYHAKAGVHRSLEYCIEQCERLADAIADRETRKGTHHD